MLTHTGNTPPGASVLLLGSQGTIGKSLSAALTLSNLKVEGLSSKDLDLTNPASVMPLAEKMKTSDHIVMLSCLTPDKGRGQDNLVKNILMAKHVSDALKQQKHTPHVVYFSADAVYSLDEALIHEDTPPSPVDTYGAMHRTRELMLLETVPQQLAIIRATLVYGPGDSHNSYGPNRFRREAFKEGSITIFGEGEDTRSHIFIEDLVKMTTLILKNKSVGIINGAPDSSITYKKLAESVANCFEKPVEIKKKPGSGSPTYRQFDTTQCYEAFPGFSFTPLQEGLISTCQKMKEDPNA